MKKIILTFTMIMGLIMTTNAQDIAMVDYNNSVTLESNDNISPEIKELMAEFMSAIKQQYFIDRGLEVPNSLEIILMSNVYGQIYTYFTFDGKMSGAKKTTYGKIIARGGFAKRIETRHKDPKNIIYQK